MSDEKKTAPKDALDEKALEGVTGGEYISPAFVALCSCGTLVRAKHASDRVQCPDCGRWFRVKGTALIEENQG